jgi:outer membrane protein TolC
MKRIYIIALCLATATVATAQQQLSLEQVKQLALEHNMAMRSADNAIKQAKEQQKEAFTNYFPQVSATGAGFKTNRDMVKASVSTADLLPASLAQVIPEQLAAAIPSTIPVSMVNKGVITGATAVQPVFMGGQIVNGNKLAKVGVEASKLQRRTTQNTVELTAEQYYWQIISIKEKQKTLDAVAAMLDKLNSDATVAVKAGVGMRNDLLQVQLRQNEVESNRLKLDNALKLAQMVLAQYIGLEGKDIDVSALVDPAQLPAAPTIKVDHDQAVTATPEYQLLQKNVEASALQRKMEAGKLLPSVAVGAGYNYYDMGSGMDSHFGMVFATVSVPISGWWGGSHAVKRRKLAEQNAREQLTDNAQLLKIRMQKDWNDVDDAYKQLVLAKKSIEQSEENLRLNRDYYHAGTVTMNDLLTAQQQYQQSRDRYTDAYAQLQVKMLEYRQSTGRE